MKQPEISEKALQDHFAGLITGFTALEQEERVRFLEAIPTNVTYALDIIMAVKRYSTHYAYGFLDAMWVIAKTQEQKQVSELEKLAEL